MDFVEAVKNNDLTRVRLLVEQGADKDKDIIHGFTPLYMASCDGHVEVAQYLVEQGAALDKPDNHGTTPLAVAAQNGHYEVVRYLLEQGADRDKADPGVGWTPLHGAAHVGHLEIAMLLMSYGADLNARTSRGQLPIDMARTEEMKQAIRDEPRRRMDHGHKRATEQDRHPNATTSASVHLEEKEVEQNSKLPGAKEETKVAEEDEDSEPSDDEEDERVTTRI